MAFKRILEDKFGDDLSKKVIEYFLDRDLEKTVKLPQKASTQSMGLRVI